MDIRQPDTPAPHGVVYAGFGARLLAYIIDGIIVFVASIVLLLPILVIMGIAVEGAGPSDEEAIGAVGMLFWWAISIVVSWVYEAGFLSSRRQATPGKMALNLAVTDARGSRISFGRGTGRFFAKCLSGFLVIGFLVQLFTDKRQALHDLMADTLVVQN